MSILVHNILPDDPPTNLKALWNESQEIYDELDIPQNKRFGTIRMTMFSKAAHPCV